MSSATFLAVPDIANRRRMTNDTNLVKAQLMKAQTELSTGIRQDRVSAANGDTAKLMSIERSIGEIEARRTTIALAQTRAATTQTALSTVAAATEDLPVLFWSEKTTGNSMSVEIKGQAAETALRHVLDTLNTEVGGRGLFNGSEGSNEAFGSGAYASAADQFIDLALTALNGATDAATAMAGFDAIFDTVWEGSGNAPGVRLGEEQGSAPVDYAVRGDAQALKDVIRGLAYAAALPASVHATDEQFGEELFDASGSAVAKGRDGIVLLQAGVGSVESRMDEVLSRDAAERTTLSMARLDLIGRDQYDAATEVTELENRLQMIYAITARTADLSFVNFFR